jgi:hypothetical protein
MKLRMLRDVEGNGAGAAEDVLEQRGAVAIVAFLPGYPELEEGGAWPRGRCKGGVVVVHAHTLQH